MPWGGSCRVDKRKISNYLPSFVLRVLVFKCLLPLPSTDVTELTHHRYSETIGILYSTTTFRMKNDDSFMHDIPRMLLPQRLAAVRFVKIEWSLRSEQLSEWSNPSSGASSPFAKIISTFPNIEMLHVYLYGGALNKRLILTRPMDYDQATSKRIIYDAADRFAQAAGSSLKEFYITVPMFIYRKWAVGKQEVYTGYPGARFWKDLPKKPLAEAQKQPSGYWIVEPYTDEIWGSCEYDWL